MEFFQNSWFEGKCVSFSRQKARAFYPEELYRLREVKVIQGRGSIHTITNRHTHNSTRLLSTHIRTVNLERGCRVKSSLTPQKLKKNQRDREPARTRSKHLVKKTSEFQIIKKKARPTKGHRGAVGAFCVFFPRFCELPVGSLPSNFLSPLPGQQFFCAHVAVTSRTSFLVQMRA